MKMPKNFVERFAYKLKFWQAIIIASVPPISLICLICYMEKTSTYNIELILICLILFFLQLFGMYIAILQTVYDIIRKLNKL